MGRATRFCEASSRSSASASASVAAGGMSEVSRGFT